jgi:hypothetical protein
MSTLIERLKNPEHYYEFTDPKKANAVLMSLCQEAADALAAPVQEPVKAMHIGWDYLDNGQMVATFAVLVKDQIAPNLYATPPAAQPAPVQEPMALEWHQAPVKTQWGDDMVVAYLAIDKDNTVSVYCERHQTAKVEAMLNQMEQK